MDFELRSKPGSSREGFFERFVGLVNVCIDVIGSDSR